MKRLRLELKQTMDMYNSACKQAISAKNQVMFNYAIYTQENVMGASTPFKLFKKYHLRDFLLCDKHIH